VRCIACDVELTDYEATRRFAVSQEFIDLCNRCAAVSLDDSDVVDRADLRTLADLEEMIHHEQDWELDIRTGTVDGDLSEV
jgi:Zn-finger nucleic acid-binding protein